MGQANRAAKTQATKNVEHVAEFTRRYEALCREFGCLVGTTCHEEFVVNVPGDQKGLDIMLKRQIGDLTTHPYQEW
jgi:hypothetical protein